MSRFGKQGTRCDYCGKFSSNKTTGKYTRKDGSCGYIWPDEADDRKDICDDETPEGVMICRHCPATRDIADDEEFD